MLRMQMVAEATHQFNQNENPIVKLYICRICGAIDMETHEDGSDNYVTHESCSRCDKEE